MFNYKLLKEEGKILVSEDEQNIFEANVIFKDDVVVLDMIKLNTEGNAFYGKESVLKERFQVLSSIIGGVKTLLCDNGVSVDRIFLGSFADVAELDLEAAIFDEKNNKEIVKVNSASRR